MDLGRLLLLISALFAVVLFARSVHAWRVTKRAPVWGLAVASLGGALCALVHLRWPDGVFVVLPVYLGMFALVPATLARSIALLVARRSYARAASLSSVLSLVQWSAAVRSQTRYLRALDAYERGQAEEADAMLAELERESSGLARAAWLTRASHARSWHEVISRLERELVDPAASADAHASTYYVRALGEVGEHARMMEAATRVLSGRLAAQMHPYVYLWVLAFGGRITQLDRLLATQTAALGPDQRAYWRATALQALGRDEEAEALLVPLRSSTSRATRRAAEARLATPARAIDPALFEREPGATLARKIDEELAFLDRAPRGAGWPWVTLAVAIANLAVFLGQPPGPDYEERLYELGALVLPMRSWAEDGWRIAAACFLHYGWTHLVLNTLALLYFGRVVEGRLGPVRTALTYILAGTGAFALMALLGPDDPPRIVVGASGAIMGLVAAQVGILLRARALRSRIGRRSLGGLVVLLVLQSAFDLLTPEVAMSGHLYGALVGLFIGLALAGSHTAEPRASS